ncbi:unnamed protein product [Moneuplotes crassus]|uniref:Uncharacterized protein n=1 Tax=Euplotes crassus TaxID=5936 RepID=A0AAD1Y4D4_EUPCR|nr:unnamed protein product [Moneuplotes crassus]
MYTSGIEDCTPIPDEYHEEEKCSINATVHEELNKNDISSKKGNIKYNEYNKFLKELKELAKPSMPMRPKPKKLFVPRPRMKKWNTRDCRATKIDHFKFNKPPLGSRVSQNSCFKFGSSPKRKNQKPKKQVRRNFSTDSTFRSQSNNPRNPRMRKWLTKPVIIGRTPSKYRVVYENNKSRLLLEDSEEEVRNKHCRVAFIK